MVRPIILTIGVLGTAAITALLIVVSYALHDAEAVTASKLETITAKLFRTNVSVFETPISFKSGKTQIIGLKVENPTGFSNEVAIHGPEIIVQIDTPRSTPDKIYVEKITIQRPTVLLEIRDGQTNLTRLIYALKAAGDMDSVKDAEVRLVVHEVLIENGELSVLVDVLGESPIKTPLPDSRITDIGVAENGISPEVFLDSLTAFIIKATERATRRINVAKVASERNIPKPEIDFKSLLAE